VFSSLYEITDKEATTFLNPFNEIRHDSYKLIFLIIFFRKSSGYISTKLKIKYFTSTDIKSGVVLKVGGEPVFGKTGKNIKEH